MPAAAADRPPPPKLPLAQWWTIALDGPVSAGPAADDSRIYLAMGSAHLTARDAADGHEVWRQDRDVRAPMATDGGLLFIAAADAVEALHGDTGKGAWVLPRTTPVAPLVVAGDALFVVTDKEILAVRAATGEVIWRREAGGVKLAPAIADDRVYLGADDGRVLALDAKTGAVEWDRFLNGGLTAMAAYRGLLYAGAGDKRLYCLDGANKGKEKWSRSLGALASGQIVVDDERVYVAALDNLVRALDRKSGNQRWQYGLHRRPLFGLSLSGHIVFVPGTTNDILLLYDENGGRSGTLTTPGDTPPGLGPSIKDSAAGAIVYAVAGGLTNEWNLAKYAPAGESVLVPFGELPALPGLPYLTDPRLVPIAASLATLIMDDPILRPWADVGWPLMLRDPRLEPLTVLPGLQLRPLSPVLPVRRGPLAPGG